MTDPREPPATIAETKSGGPARCLRPCVECSDGAHHFADPMIEFADDEYAEDTEQRREALTAGCSSWFVCKHCDAWREVSDEDMDLDDEGPESDGLGPEEHDIDEPGPGRYSSRGAS